MSAINNDSMVRTLDAEIYTEQLKSLQKKIMEYEEAAIKKDKHISQLTSRMREYEMGEYGLTEAVSEIKDCRRIIRARDREIENLTDEINALKLQMSELKEETLDEKQEDTKLSSFTNHKILFMERNRVGRKGSIRDECIHLNKTSQCKLPTIPAQYLEEFYSAQLQNENLRHELSNVCKEAIELSMQLQYSSEQDQTAEVSLHETQSRMIKLKSSAKDLNSMNNFEVDCNLKSVDDWYKTMLLHIKDEAVVQNMFQDFARQINILKNNELVLIRRYMILSDRESNLRKENLKLRKAVHINWRKNYADNLMEERGKEMMANHLTPDDESLLRKFTQRSSSFCINPTCQENTAKLVNIITKLLAEIPLLRKLLEISHHQTQAVEAMYFSQEIEMKSLREQFTLFQAQSDEKMLLGKLAMKVLQLQFNQAACIYELNKYRSNQQSFQDWYLSLKEEYEENGKRFATLYLGAQDKVKHLCEVIKDVCQRCNEALTSYINTDYKLL